MKNKTVIILVFLLFSFESQSPAVPKKSNHGDTYIDSKTGMEFVLVKGGCYQMGDTFGDGEAIEKPAHEVCVNDFYIGKYEVTQSQWQSVMKNNPSYFINCGGNCPVENVSWNDVQKFIQIFNQRAEKAFRLPTEAEWEYAARSGGKKEKWAGTSNENELGDYAWYQSNSGNRTYPVGQKKPNGLGLYDMTGNVREWVSDWVWMSDWFKERYYAESPKDNPQGPKIGEYRGYRGGSCSGLPRGIKTTSRYKNFPDIPSRTTGFRVAWPAQ